MVEGNKKIWRPRYEHRMLWKYGELPAPLTSEEYVLGMERITNAVCSAVIENPELKVLGVALFGSWAYGNPHVRSDIDYNLISTEDSTLVGDHWTKFNKLLTEKGLSNLDPWMDFRVKTLAQDLKDKMYRNYRIISPHYDGQTFRKL